MRFKDSNFGCAPWWRLKICDSRASPTSVLSSGGGEGIRPGCAGKTNEGSILESQASLHGLKVNLNNIPQHGPFMQKNLLEVRDPPIEDSGRLKGAVDRELGRGYIGHFSQFSFLFNCFGLFLVVLRCIF